LLERLPQGRAVVGAGDDAAVLEERNGVSVLATADMLVEGRHFDLAFSSPSDVGFKAIAVNVSDIAAMGGRPTFALISLGANTALPSSSLEALYDGVAEAARAFGVSIVGGDTVGSDEMIVSVAMLGEAARPVLRSGARAGDLLCVTGALGGAAAGLWLLRAAGHDARARTLLQEHPNLSEAYRRGRARVREGQAAAAAGATAMIDVSDGLAQDVSHVLEQSGCGVQIDIERIPAAGGVAAVAEWFGASSDDLTLQGGDDYELAIAVPPDAVDDLTGAMSPTSLTVIGTFTERTGIALADGTPVAAAGWDHFR
jgi:thiamine-monophosphate kinase